MRVELKSTFLNRKYSLSHFLKKKQITTTRIYLKTSKAILSPLKRRVQLQYKPCNCLCPRAKSCDNNNGNERLLNSKMVSASLICMLFHAENFASSIFALEFYSLYRSRERQASGAGPSFNEESIMSRGGGGVIAVSCRCHRCCSCWCCCWI